MPITASHIGAVAQSLGPLLAMFALIFTIRSGIQNKRADIMMECHRRSEALLILRHELSKRMFAAGDRSADALLESDIQAWIQRFWSLQFDQYEFWRRGFIDDAFFRYWMLTRHRDFSKALADQSDPTPDSFEQMIYEKGLEEVSWMWDGTISPSGGDFKGFIQDVRNNRIKQAMRKHGPSLFRSWGFWG
ncbi:hypothetical protein ACSFBX_20640 [Variovorax sp. RB2P76]|uniref:hypothetical protein n=1 Tax=Variovorax sp. RB2P76 TaxID=3443736 RepID=UPI003F486177